MKMRRWLTGTLSAVLCLSVLAGCGGGDEDKGNTLTVNLGSEPPMMNPSLTSDSTSGNVFRHVSEGLVSLDANDKAQPGVAESWELSDEGRTITFKLNPKAKWSTGEQITAKDFEFAWDVLFTPATGSVYAGTWAPLIVGAEDVLYSTEKAQKEALDNGTAKMVETKDKKGKVTGEKFTPVDKAAEKAINARAEELLKTALDNVGYKAVDDTTFEVKLTGAYPYFVDLMAFYSFLPINEKMYNDMGGLKAYGTEADKLAYNGPYVMTEWAHENQIVVEKNDKYWNKDAVKLDKITFRMIKDNNTALSEFESGQLDMVGLTGDQLKNFKKEGKKYYSYDDGGNWYFEYNTKVKPFDNKKVRRALTMAVDAETYIKTIVMNDSKIGQSFTPPAIQGGKFSEKVGQVYPRDNNWDAAKALLDEGLAEEGMTAADFKLELLGDDTASATKDFAFFQEQWESHLGIDVTIKQVPFKTRIQRMQTGDFEVVFAGWAPDYNDPMTFMDLLVTTSGNNHGKWSNAEYDALIAKAYKETNVDAREELLLQAEKIIAEEAPYGIVYYRVKDYALANGLKGVVRTAFSDIDLRFAYWDKAEK